MRGGQARFSSSSCAGTGRSCITHPSATWPIATPCRKCFDSCGTYPDLWSEQTNRFMPRRGRSFLSQATRQALSQACGFAAALHTAWRCGVCPLLPNNGAARVMHGRPTIGASQAAVRPPTAPHSRHCQTGRKPRERRSVAALRQNTGRPYQCRHSAHMRMSE